MTASATSWTARAIVVSVAALIAWPAGAPGSLAAQGSPVPAMRIVSLVPAVTEMVFALGAGDRMVGVSSFDRFPPEVERVPRVGALLDPAVERILSLRPDLVVTYHSQTDLLTQLARAGVPAFIYSHSGLADVTRTLRLVGERVGATAKAQEMAAAIERRIETVRKRSGAGGRPRTLIVFSRDAFALRGIYASGGVGFIHEMVAAAGGDNVFSDTRREAVQATTELILARAPEVILELRGEAIDAATEEKEVRTWASLSSLPAVRRGRVHIIADARTVIPGPRVAEAVELLWRVLQGTR